MDFDDISDAIIKILVLLILAGIALGIIPAVVISLIAGVLNGNA